MSIFLKGLVLLSLNWFVEDLDMMFNNVLNGRKAFLETAHDFGQKLEISSQFLFLWKRPLKMFQMETKSF